MYTLYLYVHVHTRLSVPLLWTCVHVNLCCASVHVRVHVRTCVYTSVGVYMCEYPVVGGVAEEGVVHTLHDRDPDSRDL